jgi:hypothetical protein
VQSDLDRKLNCMPNILTNTYSAPSYIMVLDSSYKVIHHWENYKEVAEDGYEELVYQTRLLLD